LCKLTIICYALPQNAVILRGWLEIKVGQAQKVTIEYRVYITIFNGNIDDTGPGSCRFMIYDGKLSLLLYLLVLKTFGSLDQTIKIKRLSYEIKKKSYNQALHILQVAETFKTTNAKESSTLVVMALLPFDVCV